MLPGDKLIKWQAGVRAQERPYSGLQRRERLLGICRGQKLKPFSWISEELLREERQKTQRRVMGRRKRGAELEGTQVELWGRAGTGWLQFSAHLCVNVLRIPPANS